MKGSMYRNLANIISIFIIVLFTQKNLHIVVASDQFCIFPMELQGEYRIQNAALNGNNRFQYSIINITEEDISPYGLCYSRNGSNFIVNLSSDDDRIACYRCFNLQMISKNILLLIHTESDINSKCSSSAETVKCPPEISLNDEKKFTNDFYSIILYRIESRHHEFCPFDGEIKFDYYLNNQKICSGFKSTISNCPSSSSMNIHFRDCTTDLQPITFDCLGNWKMQNQNFLAVIESSSNETEQKYKCGTYEYDNHDQTQLTLRINNDCSTLPKRNSVTNQQVFKIKKSLNFLESNSFNDLEIAFPDNLQGDWQYMTISKNLLTYRDGSSLKTFYMSLVTILESDKYIVRSRSQCGEENYKCIIITQLHDNVIETQISSKTLSSFTNYEICNNKYFNTKEWVTQAKIGENVTKEKCPIYGKYFGKLPDDMKLCSVISSDCKNPDIMFYQIGPCDSNDIYETRVYRCLGHWIDKKSTNVYTLTQRVDVVNTYECFVGLMTNSDDGKSIFIREAGEEGNCYKSLDPFSFGMEMNRTETCPYDRLKIGTEEIFVSPTAQDTFTKYDVFDESNDIDVRTSTRRPKTSKKQKKRPDEENDIDNNVMSSSTTASKASSVATTFYLSGLILMIHNLRNLIIVKCFS